MTWWNSVQTSKGAAGFPAGAAAFKRRLRRWGARAAGRRESGFVVREIGYFLDILGMTNPVVGIQHKNRPTLDSQVLDQRSVIWVERRIFVIAEHFHLIHGKPSAPALLDEREIHADRDNIQDRQSGLFLVAPLSLGVGNRGIE